MAMSVSEQALQLEVTARLGDLVRFSAPAGAMGEIYNGREGEMSAFNPGGWVVARLREFGTLLFRADELLVL